MKPSGREPCKHPRVPKISRKANQIEIPSTLDYLPEVVDFVEGKLKKLRIKSDHVADIAISVSEAVTNAVVHGNKNDASKRVRTIIKADSSRVEVIVEDQGAGFNRECVRSPITEQNLLKEAGRGLLIVESLMDQVDVVCGSDMGTKVRMVKFLTRD